jgi:hypothetical protein
MRKKLISTRNVYVIPKTHISCYKIHKYANFMNFNCISLLLITTNKSNLTKVASERFAELVLKPLNNYTRILIPFQKQWNDISLAYHVFLIIIIFNVKVRFIFTPYK